MFLKFFLPIIFLSLSAQVVHELGSYERVEEISGFTFKQKLFFDDAELMEDFFVDGDEVDKETFCQKKAEAYESEVQIAQERLKKIAQHDAVALERIYARSYLKLIRHIGEQLNDIFLKVNGPQLMPFWTFSENGVSSKEMFHSIKEQLVPSLAFVDDPDAAYESLTILRKLFEKLEELLSFISQFYQDTVSAALEQSDDPSALKALLELHE